MTELFDNFSRNLKLGENSLSTSFFGFFSSKNKILSLVSYKQSLIILMTDYTLINYDIGTDTKKLELKDLEKYKFKKKVDIKLNFDLVPKIMPKIVKNQPKPIISSNENSPKSK